MKLAWTAWEWMHTTGGRDGADHPHRRRASASTRSSGVMMLVVTGVGFLIHLYATSYMEGRHGLRALLRVPEPLHLRDARPHPGATTCRSSSSAGRASGSARTCSSASGTRTRRTRRRARRRSSPTASATSGCIVRDVPPRRITRGALDWNGIANGAHEPRPPGRRSAASTSGRSAAGSYHGLPLHFLQPARAVHDQRGDGRRPRAPPRLHRQERADPALRLAARRDGRPHAGLRAHPRGDDGHRRRLPHLPAVVRLRPLAVRDDGRSRSSARRPRSSPRRSRSSRTTSRRSSPTPRSASSGSCSSASASARSPRASSTSSRTRSSRPASSSARARVIHAMHARIHDDDKVAGHAEHGRASRKYMPLTAWTFFVSTLAISGLPFTSGFFSKDEILYRAYSDEI